MPIDSKLETIEVITMEVDHRLYALRLECVQEIIRMVQITKAPEAPWFVEGVIDLRGEVIPVIDVRRRLSLPDAPYSLKTPIIFIKANDAKYGLVFDRVVDVRLFAAADIQKVEDVGGNVRFIEGIAKLGGEVMFIVDLNSLLDFSNIENAFASDCQNEPIARFPHAEERMLEALRARARALATPMVSIDTENSLQVIRFQLGREHYAVRSHEIVEVLNWGRVTAVPGGPRGVAGVINLRGEIISVVDMRQVFSLSDSKLPTAPQIIIISSGAHKHGLLVDEVTGLMNLDGSPIQRPIATLSQEKAEFIEGEIESDGKIYALIKVEAVLSSVKH